MPHTDSQTYNILSFLFGGIGLSVLQSSYHVLKNIINPDFLFCSNPNSQQNVIVLFSCIFLAILNQFAHEVPFQNYLLHFEAFSLLVVLISIVSIRLKRETNKANILKAVRSLISFEKRAFKESITSHIKEITSQEAARGFDIPSGALFGAINDLCKMQIPKIADSVWDIFIKALKSNRNIFSLDELANEIEFQITGAAEEIINNCIIHSEYFEKHILSHKKFLNTRQLNIMRTTVLADLGKKYSSKLRII